MKIWMAIMLAIVIFGLGMYTGSKIEINKAMQPQPEWKYYMTATIEKAIDCGNFIREGETFTMWSLNVKCWVGWITVQLVSEASTDYRIGDTVVLEKRKGNKRPYRYRVRTHIKMGR